MESITLFKLLGEGANYAGLVVLYLVWRIDRRMSLMEEEIKHHKSTTDLKIEMIEKDLSKGLQAIRDRIDKGEK